MYSLLVAAMGRSVVAVDGMADNLAYIWYSRLHAAMKGIPLGNTPSLC